MRNRSRAGRRITEGGFIRLLLAALCALAQGGNQLKAEVTVKEYKLAIKSPDPNVVVLLKAYIRGVGEGIAWANIDSTHAKMPIYCASEKLALTVENYINMINDQIESSSKRFTQDKLDDMFISGMLLFGLKDTFPCPKGK